MLTIFSLEIKILPQCFDEISPTTGDSITTCYYIWSNVTPGLVGGNGYHSIHAIARDMNNNPSLLSPVSILIDELNDSEPPTGTIINPASGIEVNGVIDITVQATDNDTVHSVIFYVNGNPEGLVYHNPFDPDNSQGNYLFSWNTTSGWRILKILLVQPLGINHLTKLRFLQ